MTNKVTITSRPLSPKFDIERRLATSVVKKSNIKIAADINNNQFPTRAWHPDSRLQMSTLQWLNKYGLKANNLDSLTLFPKLGFPRVESFNKVLHKPIHSRYGESLFPKHFREDGLTFNIVAKKDRLTQAQLQLENAIALYQQRLDWLSSDSRRIFGVVEEHCITIIIDIKTTDKTQFDQFICALERLVEEQLRFCVKFNLIRVQDTLSQLFTSVMPVSKDTIAKAIDWIWEIDRTASMNPSNIVEAMIRASKDKEIDAIYLITEGSSSDGSREVLREKIKQLKVPFNIVSYNCDKSDFLEYLYCLVALTGGRFHTYTFNMEIDSYERSPLDEINPLANLIVSKKMYGGSVGGIGKRKDCVDIFSEMEEAKVILTQIKSLINQIPEKKVPYEDEEHKAVDGGHIPKEEYMSSREWLARSGLKARKLDFYDVLGGVCFRHCDGVVEVLEPPTADKIDLMEQQNATIHQKLVNAKYCDKFAHVRWKDGSLVHVQMSSDVHRLYNERMNICLNTIKRRIEWLRQGSRELFGTIMEDQVYILIDTSASMEPHIAFVKDKMYTLIQEQLRHKSKINFVAFNSKALPWRDRLVDVTESSLNSVWHWIEGLSCQGSTNTLAALQFSTKDRNCQGIYLLTDGRPDQPTKTVLSQIKLQHRLPIHAISFNCADLEANKFLCELARETGGRFHYFNEITGGADCADDEGLDAWESEDIQVLKAEYRLGVESLEKVTKLRDECHRLAWKKEIETQREQKSPRRIMLPGCADGLNRDKNSPTRISSNTPDSKLGKKIKSRNTFKNEKNDPVWPGTIKLLEFDSPIYSKNSGAYFAFLQTLNAHSNDEQDWMLQETKDILDRQKERYMDTVQEEMKEIMDKKKTLSKPKKTKCKELTIKQWLAIYGLVPQHMSILDALAPTIIKVRPKYIPIIDKYVMSKVFDEILPIAHVVTEGSPRKGYKPVIRLVNPLAVDLKAYQNNLEQLLQKYKKKLKQLIKDNINDKALEMFEDMTTTNPLGSEEMKAWILKIFEEAKWPVCEDDLQMFLKEIYVGHKYFIQAGDLMRVQNKTLESNRSLGEGSLDIETKRLSKHSKTENNPFSQLLQAAMTGLSVLAPGIEDGYYYDAVIINWPDCQYIEVQYNIFGDTVQLPVEECVIMPSKDPVIKPGMTALIKVYNMDNDRTFYLPGIVISSPSIDERINLERFMVLLYNGIESNVRKDEIVVISKERYDAIVLNIQNKMEPSNYNTSTSITQTLMTTNTEGQMTLDELNQENEADKLVSFTEFNRKSKKQTDKDKSQKTYTGARQNIFPKQANFLTTNSPLPHETKEKQSIPQHRPETISVPPLINIAINDSKLDNDIKQSSKIKIEGQQYKNVPEKEDLKSNFEVALTSIKDLPRKQMLKHDEEPKRKKNKTKGRKTTHSAEQKSIKKGENSVESNAGSELYANTLLNMESMTKSQSQEIVNDYVVEGENYTIQTDNYKLQPKKESNKTENAKKSDQPKIKSRIKPSPLSKSQKTTPLLIAEQFPGTAECQPNETADVTEANKILQSHENIEKKVETLNTAVQSSLRTVLTNETLQTLPKIPKPISCQPSRSFEEIPPKVFEEPPIKSIPVEKKKKISQIPVSISHTASLDNKLESQQKISTIDNLSAKPSSFKTESQLQYSEKLVNSTELLTSKKMSELYLDDKPEGQAEIKEMKNDKVCCKNTHLKPSSKNQSKKLRTSDNQYAEYSASEIVENKVDETEPVHPDDVSNSKTSQTKKKSLPMREWFHTNKDVKKIKKDQRKSDEIRKVEQKASKESGKNKIETREEIKSDNKNKKPLKEKYTTGLIGNLTDSRSPSPFTARSNVTLMNDDNSQVYNIVLTPEPAIVLVQAHSDCKSFQITSVTLSVKEIPSLNANKALLPPFSILHESNEARLNGRTMSKSSDELCKRCHLPKVPFGPEDKQKLKRTKSI